MSHNHEKRGNAGTFIWIILVAVALAFLIASLIYGNDVRLFNPKGFVASEQRSIMIFIVAVLFVIAIPTLFMAYFIAWKYRDSNEKAKYAPETRHSNVLAAGFWLIPTVFAVLLAFVLWVDTHRLEPQKALAADAKPLTVEVVALRWKWLFIYPEQNIATVNYVQIPTDTPVTFKLTADDTPMSAFWIPHLGGMLYAMTGHVNPLNLIAGEPGDYPGSTAEVNGRGFAGMKFIARASSGDEFDRWVADVQQHHGALDDAEYGKLLKPSENNLVAFYSSTDDGLYDKVLMKYMVPSEGHGHAAEKHTTGHEGH